MKRKNSYSFIYVTLAFVAIFGLTYGMFGSILGEASYAYPLDGSRPVFVSDSDRNKMEIKIPASLESSLVSENAFKVSLQNNYQKMTICHYDMYFNWDENPDGYYVSPGALNELAISATVDGVTRVNNVSLNGYNLADLKTYLTSYYVTNDGGEITNQNWQVKINFNKEDINQAKLAGKSYYGKVTLENINCTAVIPLSALEDDIIGKYMCLGSNGLSCEEENLYQIIAKDAAGIKLISTKNMGIGTISENFLARINDNYLGSVAKDYQEAIANHIWNNNYTNKIGLPSYNDYTLGNLKDLTYPYLILMDDELKIIGDNGINEEGTTSYIYPSFYLNNNVVVSNGDGSINNPYYIN